MEQKSFKTKTDEFGTQVLFWDEYTFLGKKYYMEEIDTASELALMDIFLNSGLKQLKSMNDLLSVNPMDLLTTLLKEKAIFAILALLLKRIEGDGRIVATTSEEFQKGKAKLFHPMVKEVVVDFFYLNSELLQPIIQFVKGFTDQAKALTSLVPNLTT